MLWQLVICVGTLALVCRPVRTQDSDSIAFCIVPCARFIGVAIPISAPVPAYKWEQQSLIPSMMRYPGPFVTFRKRRRRRRDLELQQFCKVPASMCIPVFHKAQNPPPIIQQNPIEPIINAAGNAIQAAHVTAMNTAGPVVNTFLAPPLSMVLSAVRPQDQAVLPASTEKPTESSTVYSEAIVIGSQGSNHNQPPPLLPEMEDELEGASYCLIKGTKSQQEAVTCQVIEYFPVKDCITSSGLVAVCTADGNESGRTQVLDCESIEKEQFLCREGGK